MRAIFIIIACLLHGVLTKAQPIIRVEQSPFCNLGKQVAFWKDESGKSDFQQVEKKSKEFKQGKSGIFNGRSNGAVWWIKVRFINNEKTQPYLFIDYSNIDNIDLYYRDSLNRIQHIQSGMFGLKKTIPQTGTGFSFLLSGVQGKIKEVYVRMHATNTLLIPVKVISEHTLNAALLKTYSIQLIYAGIGLMLLIFHVFMYIITKSRLFALYMGRIVLLYYFGMVFYLQGYGLLLGQNIAQFILTYAHFFIAAGYICSIIFNNRFLKLRRNMPVVLKIFQVVIVLWSAQLILSLFGRLQLTNEITQFLSFITSMLMLYSSINVVFVKRIGKPRTYINFYVIGWIPVALVSIYLMLCLQDVIPFKSYSYNFLTLAGMLEGIFISLGLFGQRLKLLARHNAHFRKQDMVLRMQMENYKNELRKKDNAPKQYLTELATMAKNADSAFLSTFMEKESGFIESLQAIAPTLLATELELSAFMRLNMDTKEIARVCRQTVRAVESKKYRLRKKLNLSGEVNLQIWMLQLAESS